jgi:hypothetical protein
MFGTNVGICSALATAMATAMATARRRIVVRMSARNTLLLHHHRAR